MQNNIILDFIYFPFWWYKKAIFLFFKSFREEINYYWKILAVDIWVKNIFVPMYGQYSWSGRIISFFMRFFNIIIRFFLFLLLFVFYLFLYLLKSFSVIIILYLLILQIIYFIN